MIAIPNMEKPKEGLYQIDHGKIHKYKDEGGTVRVYDLIEIEEPKRGKWIPYKWYIDKEHTSWTDEVKCSICGYKYGEADWKYCPECGARMEPYGERREE